MYKLLLAGRYLRSHFIALASIVSVTLGVATLIVVNSVMAGFTTEMHKRLHGILSDIELMSPGLGEIYDAEGHIREIKQVLGDDVEAVSAVVRVPALVHQRFNGKMVTQQILLLGIDDETYAKVSDFEPYLLNAKNRAGTSFKLHEDGYDERLGESGWSYRRKEVEFQRVQEQLYRSAFTPQAGPTPTANLGEVPGDTNAVATAAQQPKSTGPILAPLPEAPPVLNSSVEHSALPLAQNPTTRPAPINPDAMQDPFADVRKQEQGTVFDPMKEQHAGIILGMALVNRKYHDPETGKVKDVYITKPGDDVQITLPTSGDPPVPTSSICTCVDLYESKMHEYDSMFAFVSLSHLQKIRRMIDADGVKAVSSIQIKLKPGADIEKCRDKLVAHFPPDMFPYQVQTWMDIQRPLLAAVEMEITILNILLFMIIAVAGFGILATFYMIVIEKTKDIGVLKALGAPSYGVMSIFLSYGLSLGIVGAGVGIVLGISFAANINRIAGFIEYLSGREVFDPTIYYFNEIPTIIDPFTCVWIAIGAMTIAILASVLPARKAARMNPVEALRYE